MKRKKVRNPKPIKPAQAPGPLTNKRVANKPFKPARGRFIERSALNDPGPEDLTHFDASPEQQVADFFDSRAIVMDDE